MKKFWMVFVEGGNYPKYKHISEESALTEAKRLAELTGKEVFILTTTKVVSLKKFDIIDLTCEELPF